LDRLRKAAALARPCVADRLTAPPITIAPTVEPEPEAPAPTLVEELSDYDLLSRRVAAHYAEARA
jgi:hypothetical protein